MIDVVSPFGLRSLGSGWFRLTSFSRRSPENVRQPSLRVLESQFSRGLQSLISGESFGLKTDVVDRAELGGGYIFSGSNKFDVIED